MSDTDDTDRLLLISPDFFVIRSPICTSPVGSELVTIGKTCLDCDNISSLPVDYLCDELSSISVMNSESTPYAKFSGSYPLLNFAHRNTHLANSFSNSNELSPLEKRNDGEMFGNYRKWATKTNSFTETPSVTYDSKIVKQPTTVSNSFQSNRNAINTQNGNVAPKSNLPEVDQLLQSMQKTQSEIRNKLLSSGNKIEEMRENGNANCYRAEINSRKQISIPETCKPFVDFSKDKLTEDARTKLESIQTNGVQLPRDTKNMLQLSKIMSSESNTDTLLQKLEAEILKKKHCEEIIQQLQSSLLEQQQNLTVAQKVDAEKEEIIGQLQSAWLQLVDHWKELEYQRQELATMLEQERVEARDANANFTQKIDVLEARLHEAISLASGYREKNDELEKTLKTVQETMIEYEANFKKSKEFNKIIEEEKSNLFQQLQQTNNQLIDEKQKCLLLESSITKLETEISALSFEKNELLEKLRHEKNAYNDSRLEIAKLKECYNETCHKEVNAAKEMRAMKQEIIKAKNNLKEYYQNQLDSMLRQKVDEFQRELENARTILEQEFRQREKLSQDKFNSELRQAHENHKLELSEERRINQKHVNILKAELKDGRKKIIELANRSKADAASKMELTKRVNSVLKSQWLDTCADVLSENEELCKAFSSNINGTYEDRVYDNEDEFSDRDAASSQPDRMTSSLKKYISALLEKEPGNPVDDYKSFESLLSQNKTDFLDRKQTPNQKNLENYRRKPPWK